MKLFKEIPQFEEPRPEDLIGSKEVRIPKEFQVPEKQEQRFSPEEARLEANMMRIKLKEALEHEPTAEDYDRALAMVEEMKREAFTESKRSEGDKAFFKLVQIGQKYFDKGIDGFVRLLSLGFVKSDPNSLKERVEFWDDAETKLNRLKAKAEKLDLAEADE